MCHHHHRSSYDDQHEGKFQLSGVGAFDQSELLKEVGALDDDVNVNEVP